LGRNLRPPGGDRHDPEDRLRGATVRDASEPPAAGPERFGAPKEAEAPAARLPSAPTLKLVADDQTGKVEGVTILGQLGNIPDDFAKTLQGG
jgi:hypothetical protein